MPTSKKISTDANNYNIVVCGNYGAGNLGDELILDGLLTLVVDAFPQANIIVLSADSHHTEKHHGVVSLPMLPAGVRSLLKGISSGSRAATLQAIQHADLFILGGGGLFTDEFLKAVFIWSTQAKAALKYKIPLWCCGQSIGPLKTRLGQETTKKIYSQAELVIVRDKASHDLLSSWGVANVNVLPDPAFAITTDTCLQGLSSTTIIDKNTPFTPPYIALSLRPWKTPHHSKLLDTIADFILWIYEKYKLSTVLLPFQLHPDNDEAVLTEVLQRVRKKNSDCAKLISYNPDYRKTLHIIQGAEAVVGMRLHSLIMSTILHKPFIGLSYSNKVTNFIHDLGLPHNVLHWETLDTQELQNTFSTMMKNSASLQKHLAVKHSLWQRQVEGYVALFKKHATGLKNMKFF